MMAQASHELSMPNPTIFPTTTAAPSIIITLDRDFERIWAPFDSSCPGCCEANRVTWPCDPLTPRHLSTTSGQGSELSRAGQRSSAVHRRPAPFWAVVTQLVTHQRFRVPVPDPWRCPHGAGLLVLCWQRSKPRLVRSRPIGRLTARCRARTVDAPPRSPRHRRQP
jgi:hypothetical protein